MNRIYACLAFCLISSAVTFAKDYSYRGGRDKSTGLTKVGKNGKYGFINDFGDVVVPIIYDDINDDGFGDGFRPAVVRVGDKYGLIASDGRKITEFKYDALLSFGQNNNLAPFYVISDNGIKSGYLDLKGNVAIPERYTIAYPFVNGYAAVSYETGESMKYGLIDESGREILSPTYEDVGWGVYNDKIWVKRKNRWGLIDLHGNTVVPFEYNSIALFFYSSGDANLIQNGTTVYFDNNGQKFSTAALRDRSKISHELASLQWIDNNLETANPDFRLRAGIQSKSKIRNVNVAITGKRGAHVVEVDGYDYMVDEPLHLQEGANYITVTVNNAAGSAVFKRKIIYRPVPLPEIVWDASAEKTNNPKFPIVARIKSKSKIEEAGILIDGKRAYRGQCVVADDGFDYVVSQTINLNEGNNEIQVFVRNATGAVTSSSKIVNLNSGKYDIPNQNDRRLALVIGNSGYSDPGLKGLKNPVNDAKAVGAKLSSIGYTVIEGYDLKRVDMQRLIDRFCREAAKYGVALLFYAGHGVSIDNISYILPVDADQSSDLRHQGIECNDISMFMDKSMPENSVKVMVFDACRNMALNTNAMTAHRGVSPTQPFGTVNLSTSGSLIIYSTASGSVAWDFGPDNAHSPFTSAFLMTLDEPLNYDSFYQKLRNRVASFTNQMNPQQWPEYNPKIMGDFFFNPKYSK